MPPTQDSTAGAQAFLEAVGLQGELVEFNASQPIYHQGDKSDGVLYVLSGEVTLSLPRRARAATVIATVGAGEFFGEGCLTGQTMRLTDARATTAGTARLITADAMSHLLRTHRAGSEQFVTHLLRRSIEVEGRIVRHVFNAGERRLARALMRLALESMIAEPQEVVPAVSESALAEIAGSDPAQTRAALARLTRDGLVEQGTRADSFRVEPPLTRAMLRE